MINNKSQNILKQTIEHKEREREREKDEYAHDSIQPESSI